MRIFTLGKNGITLFYFAFILFSGTYSYGQQVDSCGVTDQNTEAAGNQQYFCDSQEAELNDLLVSGTNISYYEDSNYSTELDATDLLVGGTTYYINVDGCSSSVTVTIFNQPQILGVEEDALTRRPEASTKQSLGTLGLCVADVDSPGIFVSDLRTNAPEGTIQWYMSATGTGEPQPIANPAAEELQNNTYYYAERVYNDPVDSELNCATNRARTLVLLTAEAAPEATPEQEFCSSDNPTVGDIVASGDNRYYSTATSEVEISQNALLEDGRTYYVSTLGQSCESELRTPVTVTVQEPVELEDQVGTVCETEVSETFPDEDSIREFYVNLLGDGYSVDGTFEPTIDEIIEDYANSDGTGDFTTTYTVNTGLCESQADLTISITPAAEANAGGDQQATLCIGEGEQNLFDLLGEDATQGGAFVGYDGGTFDPSTEGAGTYQITYTVSESDEESCITGTSSAVITIIVNDGEGDLGEDQVAVICETDISSTFPDDTAVEDFYLALLPEGVSQTGTFEPSIQELVEEYQDNSDGLGDFTTTYTVGDDECTGSIDLTISIIEAVEANTGDIADVTVCSAEGSIDLFAQLSEANTPGGTFFNEAGDEIANGTFSTSEEGEFTITYTVSEDDEETCLTGTNSTSFTVNVTEGTANAGDDVLIELCAAQVDNFIANPAEAIAFLSGIIDEDVDQTGTFEPSLGSIVAQWTSNPIGTFNSTYTVGNDECEDSAEITIVVTEDGPSLGEEQVGIICESDVSSTFPDNTAVEDFYLALLPEGVSQTGTFEPSIQEMVEEYQDDSDGLGDFTTTYTVDNGECVASVDLTIRINEAEDANAGTIADQTVCSTDGLIDLSTYLSDEATNGGTFSGTGVEENGMFNPSTGADVYTITYFVDDSADCVTPGTEDSTTFEIEVLQGADLGEDLTATVCETDLADDFGADDFTAYYMSLLGDLPANGTFSPSLTSLYDDYTDQSTGTFTTTYTVGSEACEDSVQISLTINEEEDANAGTIADQTVCSTDGLIDLSTYLSDEATSGGTFSGTGVDENGMFNPATGVDVYTITYSVDDSADCVTPGTEDSTTFEIEVLQGADLGEDITATVCETDLADDFGADDFTAYYMSLLGDLPANGTFSPSLTSLYDDYTDQSTGTFTTTYTVGSEACEDSVQISLTINEEEDANAGTIADQTVCSTDGLIDLSAYLSDEATLGGTFSGTGVDENGMFNPATGVDVYTITYFVDDSADCVTSGTEDSTTFEIEVLEGPDAGSNNSADLCNADIQAGLFDGDIDLLRAFYLDLLDEGVSREGTFTTNLQDLIDRYDSGDEIGAFTAIYSVSNGNCENSVELTLNVITGEEPNAGEDMDLAFCTTEGAQDLTEYLADGVNTTGSFEGLEDGIFDPSELEAGEYTYTYTVITTGECGGADTATITVTLSDSPEAPEVDNAVYCVSEGATVADLDAERGLNWYSTADLGTPALADDVLVEGPYYVTQTNEGGCESEATEITVTLEDTAAPTLGQDGNVFCEFDNPTIADLENNITETGDITWYDAATGGEAYSSAELLEDGMTYYASLTDATSACESSQRLAVTVTLESCELLIPEAFSPNGDGINDRFDIENLSAEYPNFGMEIYNRWGNKVFTGNSSNSSWDGTSDDGSLGDGVLPVGVYFYILNFNDGQTAPIQGRVYLSR
ncbi:hypothetical protein GCM10007103_22750 [Salinimicrobium marinum]|uniref:Ig-like domain-containing protein n=1 Tax=Salinimicrobium marinum TaxID=680283 RepID=A0A918SGV5_9FLAO|nr:gliding motility-associated C-terminal domain-containing protein [Salinimicrobium marinum]GHA40863.1 hypothetical protein GCM10007103_22750 [Salinimicrobium marinum]